MGLEVDINNIIHSLHDSFFDNNKVTVRQADSFTFKTKLPIPNSNLPILRYVPTSAFQHIDTRSFRDVAKGAMMSGIPSITVQPLVENDEWLGRSLVGWLSSSCSPSAAAEKMKTLIDLEVDIRYMGGNMLLLSCKSMVDFNYLFKNRILLSPLFDEVKMWEQDDVGNLRLAWIRCTGVPLHVWGADLFKKIGAIWGDFISLDRATMERTSLESGRVLIRTGIINNIAGFVNIDVGSKRFKINVLEESFEGFNLDSKGYKMPVTKELKGVAVRCRGKGKTIVQVSEDLSSNNNEEQNSVCHTPMQFNDPCACDGVPSVAFENRGFVGNSHSASTDLGPSIQVNMLGNIACHKELPKNIMDFIGPSALKTRQVTADSLSSLGSVAVEAVKTMPSSEGHFHAVSEMGYLSAPVTCNLHPRRTKNLCVILKNLSKGKKRGRNKLMNSPLVSEDSLCQCQDDRLKEDVVEDSITSSDIVNRNKVIKDLVPRISLGVFDPSKANLLTLTLRNNIDKDLYQA